MDHRELKRLVQLMNDNDLVELEIEREGLRVSLRKAAAHLPVPAVAPLLAAPGVTNTPPPGAEPAAPEAAPDALPPGVREIRSPMVGTFYRRPGPESEPYVNLGDPVNEDTVVCIIEAMKVNNEIKAEMEGQIEEILVDDAQPVEYDTPLFRVKVL